MKISIIIPTYNGADTIPRLIAGIRKQSLNPDEILVIDSSSSDNSAELCRQAGYSVRIIGKGEFDHGGTRTIAGKIAVGDILIYLTQDVMLEDENTLQNLTSIFFSDYEVAAVYGRQLPFKNASFFSRCLRENNYGPISYKRILKDRETLGFKAAFLSDSFAAYRKEVLEELGWFKAGMIFGEDSEICARILLSGYAVFYNADARVYHSHNYSLTQEFKRSFDIGVFHSSEADLLHQFGKAEGEGIRYVFYEMRQLIRSGKGYLLSASLVRNGAKYLGYKLGKKYEILPHILRKSFSMNKGFWDKRTI